MDWGGARLAGISTGDLVEMAEAVAAELAMRSTPESGNTAMRWAETLGRCIDLAEAALAGLVGRVDACGAHQEFGFPSTVAWLRDRLGMRHGRAVERVTLARQLPRLARSAKLLTSGSLSAGFATAICAAVPRLDDADAADAEDILLQMVSDGCTVQQVGKAADRITDLIRERHGEDPEPEESRRGFKRSWLQRAKSLDGGAWLKGWFTPEHAAAFDEIVGPLAKPKAQGDDRDLGQRTADAVMSVLTEGNKGAGITVIIDLAAYTAATGDTGPFTFTPRADHCAADHRGADRGAAGHCGADRGAAGHCGADRDAAERGAAGHAADGDRRAGDRSDGDCTEVSRDWEAVPWARAGVGRVAARLLDGTQISAADARRLALNGGINALLLGHDGLPLYLGRTARFATPAQRKALLAMYETCCVHGCQIPAHLSEIHHLDGGWKLGTPTDLHKLVPACSWHNRYFEGHQDQITQTRDARGRVVLTIRPPWNPRSRATASTGSSTAENGGIQPGAP